MTDLQRCQDFWQARRSVILSTQDQAGLIETSVTPFISDEQGCLYVFISELAQHTQNLLNLMASRAEKTDQIFQAGGVSALLVADESETEQLYARERITLKLDATEITRGSVEYDQLIAKFEAEFGEVIGLLNSLPDFHLIQLKPISGGYVIGFGKAFTFDGFLSDGLTPISKK
ncbi:MAG: heme oxygenase (biliverdin-IX-beta and delta-forming) [Thiomicrorhabdus sp.]|nr:MAG: heme oxygenase (biliverdin-IX-beta and delta-forming) [Thiomicrorhabdus sp.]